MQFWQIARGDSLARFKHCGEVGFIALAIFEYPLSHFAQQCIGRSNNRRANAVLSKANRWNVYDMAMPGVEESVVEGNHAQALLACTVQASE